MLWPSSGIELDAAVALEASDEELVKRLSGRRQSEATGNIYHVEHNPPPEETSRKTPVRSYHARTTGKKRFAAAWRSTTSRPSR